MLLSSLRARPLPPAEPQRTAPATSPAQAAPTRNVGGTELPNFGNDQFELPDFLKRGSF